MIKIIIDDVPPSNNVFMGQKTSYFTYQKKKKEWLKKVHEALPIELPKKPLKSCNLNLHYIYPDKRKRDLDNYSGKFIIDALVRNSIIEDDNYFILNSIKLSAEHIPKIKKTIIEIVENE